MRPTAALAAGWRIATFTTLDPATLWEPRPPLRAGTRLRDMLGPPPEIDRRVAQAIGARWRAPSWRSLMRRHRYDAVAMMKELIADDMLALKPAQGWPMAGPDGQWITRDRFCAVHAGARGRLRRICAGEQVARELEPARQRLEEARQRQAAARERTGIIRLPAPSWETLQTHLDYLFLLSAELWGRFRVCEECDGFFIDRSGKGGHACSAECRVKAWRR